MDFAPFEVEIDAAQRLGAAEALDDAVHNEQRILVARVHFGPPQDWRSTMAASSSMVRSELGGTVIRSLRRRAARRAASGAGCATSLGRGSKQSVHPKSSKP